MSGNPSSRRRFSAWHNIAACLASRTTSPPLLLITKWMKRRASTPPAHASDAPNVVGRLAKQTAGLVTAGICGTPSTLAGYAPRASTNGLRPSASPVSSGRHTRTGMRNDLLMLAFDGKVAVDTN
jgi:hypothetical protein